MANFLKGLRGRVTQALSSKGQTAAAKGAKSLAAVRADIDKGVPYALADVAGNPKPSDYNISGMLKKKLS